MFVCTVPLIPCKRAGVTCWSTWIRSALPDHHRLDLICSPTFTPWRVISSKTRTPLGCNSGGRSGVLCIQRPVGRSLKCAWTLCWNRESPLFFSKLSNVWSNWLESPNCARPVLLLGFWHYYRYVNALVDHRLSIKPSEGDLTGSVQFKLVSGRLMAAALRWKL